MNEFLFCKLESKDELEMKNFGNFLWLSIQAYNFHLIFGELSDWLSI